MKMLKIAIITGSTRPTRINHNVSEWVYNIAANQYDATFELIDILDYNLPMFDEPMPPLLGKYQYNHTKVWAEKIARFDSFVFVTPEYNHSIPAALKNAIDFLYKEWNNKSAGFVSYGATGGLRAIEHLRLILSEVQIAHVRSQVSLSLYSDFENLNVIKPRAFQHQLLNEMLEQVILWSTALKQLRSEQSKI